MFLVLIKKEVYMKKVFLSLVLSVLSVLSFQSSAQNLYLGFPPGGAQSIVASVLLDNISSLKLISKLGANGIFAVNECLEKSDNLCITSQAQIKYAPVDVNQKHLVKYDSDSYKIITIIARSPNVFLSNKPFDKVKTVGAGTNGLKSDLENINKAIKVPFTIVAYPGVGEVAADLTGGHIDAAWLPLPAAKKIMASSTSLKILFTSSDYSVYNILSAAGLEDTKFYLITSAKNPDYADLVLRYNLLVRDNKFKSQLDVFGFN